MKDVYIILGPPYSGKTSQADLLAKYLSLTPISWGSISRVTGSSDSAKNSRGHEKVVLDKVKSAITESNSRGIVLEGYPKHLREAQELKRLLLKDGHTVRAVIQINISLPTLLGRVGKRLTCPKCGRTYDSAGDLKTCHKDGSVLLIDKLTREQAESELRYYASECPKVVGELNEIAECFFTVSGDISPALIFARIILNLDTKTKDLMKAFQLKSTASIPTSWGTFQLSVFQSKVDFSFHLALTMGELEGASDVLTRVHSSCITGDIFRSLKCDCGEQLSNALEMISREGRGALIYLFQEGRGVNIINKVEAYKLQEQGLDTIKANEELDLPSEMRDYGAVKDMLSSLGVKTIRLLTNNPEKVHRLEELGVIIEGLVPLCVTPNAHNAHYLNTKRDKMDHNITAQL